MKLVTEKKLNRKSNIFPLVVMIVFFILSSLVSNYLYLQNKLSFDVKSVTDIIAGNEEEFIEPMVFEELVFTVHFESVFYMFAFMMAFLIAYRVFKNRIKLLNAAMLFLSLTVLISIYSLLFVEKNVLFAYVFVYGFYISNIFFSLILVYSLWKMGYEK